MGQQPITRSDIDDSHWDAMRGRDLPWLVNSWVQRTPDKDFLIWAPFSGEDKVWTYAEFDHDARRLAAGLIAQGVKQGDRILIHMTNCPEFVFSWYACALIGATAVTTNTHSVARDIRYFVDHAEISAAITQPQFAELLADAAPALDFIVVTADNSGEVAGVVDVARECLAYDMVLADQPWAETRSPDPALEFAIQFTSGTTSRPKAVVWTHANVIWGAQTNARHFGLRHDDICLSFLPLFHNNNQCYSLLGSLWVGGSYILQPKFSRQHFWTPALKYSASWCSMIPFCGKALMHDPVPEHQFRLWVTAVSVPFFEELFKLKTLGLFGMTETISQVTIGDTDHPNPFMCIGRVSPGYDIAIRDEDGRPTPKGETGRLFVKGVRGVSLFKEYLKNPQATAEAFDEEGWFITGDRARMEANGELYFADREKDMLKVGGENVAASEIEAVIMESGWADEVAVVAQKHYMLDEVPVAFIIPNANAPENLKAAVIDHCRANLASFKVVSDVHVVADLPRSTLEKVAKNKLREQLSEISA